MFSSLLKKVKRNFSLRMTLWHTIVSLIVYFIIFNIAYYSLLSSVKKEDEKIIVSKFNKYREYYDESGLQGLQSQISIERNTEKPVMLFVRIADKNNHTLLLSLPDQWEGFGLTQLGAIKNNTRVQYIRPDRENTKIIYEVLSFPLEDGNFMQIGKEISYREELLSRFRQIFFSITIPAILLVLLGGYIVTFRALLPIRHLINTIKSIINTGEIKARVPSGKEEDEFNELIAFFNNLLDRIEHLIEGMKDSLDNVAHDLRTPMTRLRVLAENALTSNQDLKACREALSDCLEESERVIKMLNTLMDISEARAGTLKLYKERLNLDELVQEVVDVYRFIAEEKDITINTEISDRIIVFCDPNRIRQVIGNLLDNAIKYTFAGGEVNIRIYKKEAGKAVIEVNDNGIGINEKDLPKIWDRLYRGDQSRSQRGLGLGLSVVKSVVELHGGHMEVKSKQGLGSTFTVYLPTIEKATGSF